MGHISYFFETNTYAFKIQVLMLYALAEITVSVSKLQLIKTHNNMVLVNTSMLQPFNDQIYKLEEIYLTKQL